MMSFPQSPFRASSGRTVSGTVGSLCLSGPSGHPIPVRNLSEKVEVGAGRSEAAGLPRSGRGQKVVSDAHSG